MRNGVTCGFCHQLVWSDDETWPYCPGCGHRANRSRLECDCEQCWQDEVRWVPVDHEDHAD